MPLDNEKSTRVCIGYDLRVSGAPPRTSIRRSFDPTIWSSIVELDEALFLRVYSVKRVADIGNGLNLYVYSPPQIPEGWVEVAFDAPYPIVEYMSDSFGLRYCLSDSSEDVLTSTHICLGFDVADMWTQTSFLAHFSSESNVEIETNQHGLITSLEPAQSVCKIADLLRPEFSPFQPVGVWLSQDGAMSI